MFLLKKILAILVLPPAGPLLLTLVGLWLVRRRPRVGHFAIALGLGGLLLLSTPWVANELLRGLEAGPAFKREDLAKIQAIVILGGDSYLSAPEYGGDTIGPQTLERLRYGARLARESGLPVGLAGGAPLGGKPEAVMMRESLEADFRLATRWIESESRDTVENAKLLAPQLKQSGVTHIALVTHAWHVKRAQEAFEKQGLSVLPASTRFAPPYRGDIVEWLPQASAMRNSQIALHEWLGILATRAGEAMTGK